MTRESEESLRFREKFHRRIEGLVSELRVSRDDHRVAEAIREATARTSRSMVQTLARDRSRMLTEHADMWIDVERIVRETWGDALDKLYAIIICCEELARIWNYANVADAEAEDDAMFSAMSSIAVRTIRTALEVHLLLSRGFPGGATARARSIYELAVVARALSTHGPDSDLARRYIGHRWIDQYQWANEYQQRTESTGEDPLPADEVEAIERARVELVARYGQGFDQSYGWAAPLFEGGRLSPARLASTVDMEHGRPDYVAHSHHVHPTALGGELNMEVGGQVASWRLSGLAEPANSTMVRLAQVLSDTLTHGRTGVVNHYDMLGLSTVFQLVEEAEKAFLDAEQVAAARISVEVIRPEPPPMRPSHEWGNGD
jgi:hypothetical protein